MTDTALIGYTNQIEPGHMAHYIKLCNFGFGAQKKLRREPSMAIVISLSNPDHQSHEY